MESPKTLALLPITLKKRTAADFHNGLYEM